MEPATCSTKRYTAPPQVRSRVGADSPYRGIWINLNRHGHSLLDVDSNHPLRYLPHGKNRIMEVPSSDFKFSFSSPSEVVLTPSSSSRGNHQGGSTLNPQTPRSIPLFQSLSLNDSPGSMLSHQAQSSNSWLSPGSSPATYAQQHNASPSPSPRPVPVPSSHGGRQAERSRSIFSTSTRETPRIPGAFPEMSIGEETCPSERHAAESEEDSDSDQCSDIEEMPDARTSDLREEELPPAPVYKSRLQDGLKDVKRELGILADMMAISQLCEKDTSDLYALNRDIKKMSTFKYPETRTVGFIGDSGVGMAFQCPYMSFFYSDSRPGKSSLINSLLDKRSLSRSVSVIPSLDCPVKNVFMLTNIYRAVEAQLVPAW